MFEKLPEWVAQGSEIVLYFDEPGRKPYAERARVVEINLRHVVAEITPEHRFQLKRSEFSF